MIKFILIFILFHCISGFCDDLNKFKIILSKLESNDNDRAIGDNGKAIGRYQIHLVCYQDATNFNKSIKFSYNSLTNKVNSDIILESYLNKYKKSNSFEDWARLWNAGPNWNKKLNKTDLYWARFKQIQNNL
jgi:hypothetical protein